IQWFATKFPTQWNREFSNAYQGKFFKEQGIFTPDASILNFEQPQPTFAGNRTCEAPSTSAEALRERCSTVTKRSMVLGRLPFYGEPEVSPDRSQASSLSAEELVVAYHERTKHHFHRFAASVGYMDWATQPDPFRRYDGASLVRLPFPEM